MTYSYEIIVLQDIILIYIAYTNLNYIYILVYYIRNAYLQAT